MEKLKFTKILTTIALAGGIFVSSLGNDVAFASTVHYKDVNQTDNFYDSVEFLLDKEAISKTLPNFRPYENITRGQFASIFVKAAEVIPDEKPLFIPKFNDVPKIHQFYPYVQLMAQRHYLSGYGKGNGIRYAVNDHLTRGQMADILIRVYGIPVISEEIYIEKFGHAKSDMFDGKKFKTSRSESIGTLRYLGVMGGFSDGNYKPNHPIKRSQLANMIHKAEQVYVTTDMGLINGIHKTDVTLTQVVDKIKTLKNNEVMNFIDTYDLPRTDGVENWTDTNVVLNVKKEGEILFNDLNFKIIVSKRDYNRLGNFWKFEVDKIN